ncbi:glutamyl-tRNA reductase [Pontibacter sp. BAB1700]|uniref:glutamyl-tRNA reductase n=1 Tax=Pontibacter sp. BAB1700 TaxID=1144253 RepID=UPI00026BC9C5|nr:glutamyl-tRNA reductase [Pontibacter sp. BAB1700]EJF09705.1 glutamyl-tRNA reductase [Pontibacter sp. BAB1700]
MKHTLQVISISHQTATLEQRQALQLSREEATAFMQELKAAGLVEGVLVLTTCNRTEVYYETTATETAAVQQALLRFKDLNAAAFAPLFTYHSYSESTLYYLLEVGLGLRSRVLGDRQIIGQLKDSYRLTNDLKLGSPLLHQALQTLFRAHKRVHNETDFRVGAASVGYAALERLTDFFPRKDFAAKRMLIIGTGQMGTDIARYASSFGFKDIVLTNRTDARAELLAQELGVQHIAFRNYTQELNSFDVVVSCVGGGAQLQAAAFGEAKGKRVLLDLSVPQGIAPEAGQLTNTTLVNIDQISRRTQAVLVTRQAAIAAVEQIIAEETEVFSLWLQDQPVAQAIGELKTFFAEVLGSELQKHISPADNAAAQAIAKATLDRLIRRPAAPCAPPKV